MMTQILQLIVKKTTFFVIICENRKKGKIEPQKSITLPDIYPIPLRRN